MNERYILIKTLRLINFSKSKLYEELGWEPLYKRREKLKLILMDKIINGHTPNYLSDLVQPYAENVHNYNLLQQISNENLQLEHFLVNLIHVKYNYPKQCQHILGQVE
jgi:hypothetical protein